MADSQRKKADLFSAGAKPCGQHPKRTGRTGRPRGVIGRCAGRHFAAGSASEPAHGRHDAQHDA